MPVSTTCKSSLLARDTQPAICPWISKHLLDETASFFLLLANEAQLSAPSLDPLCELVSQAFKRPEVEQSCGTAGNFGQVKHLREGLCNQLGGVDLKRGDLAAKGRPCTSLTIISSQRR
jgi:hypothetical protein